MELVLCLAIIFGACCLAAFIIIKMNDWAKKILEEAKAANEKAKKEYCEFLEKYSMDIERKSK